jgi:hypothetical protein
MTHAPRPPPRATAKWQSSISETRCTWSDACGQPKPALVAILALSILVAVGLAYGLALGFASLVAALKGMEPLPASVIADPVLWLPLVGACVLVGVFALWLMLTARIYAFSFDSASQQMEYSESRWLRQPVSKRIPFDAIVEVVPTLLTTYATAGHFQVTVRLARSKTRSLWFGDDIPLTDLLAQSDWLAVHLGQRVRPVLRLDC